MNNFFSIIIPTYNRANLIVKTIDSVLNQNYSNFEIIIIDDGSTDHTKSVIESLENNKISYFKKENEERGAARNFGIKKAKGNYITFLDSDDLLLKNHLEEANKFITNNKPNIFFQLFEIKDIDNNLLQNAISNPKNISQALIYEGNIFACQGAFLKKEIFQSYLFNEDRNMAGSEDYELWLRINTKETILCNPIVTSVLVEHNNRSVLNNKATELIKRKELMLKSLFNDKDSNLFYSPFKSIIYSNSYAYISIHLILSNSKKTGFNYYIKALKKRPLLFFSRKSIAILKHLILS